RTSSRGALARTAPPSQAIVQTSSRRPPSAVISTADSSTSACAARVTSCSCVIRCSSGGGPVIVRLGPGLSGGAGQRRSEPTSAVATPSPMKMHPVTQRCAERTAVRPFTQPAALPARSPYAPSEIGRASCREGEQSAAADDDQEKVNEGGE